MLLLESDNDAFRQMPCGKRCVSTNAAYIGRL
jgi:hypothetical protein